MSLPLFVPFCENGPYIAVLYSFAHSGSVLRHSLLTFIGTQVKYPFSTTLGIICSSYFNEFKGTLRVLSMHQLLTSFHPMIQVSVRTIIIRTIQTSPNHR